MSSGAGIADVADGTGIVAGPKIEAASDDGGLGFAFRQENAVETNEESLLGNFGEVDVDGGALGDGSGGGNVLGDFEREAARSGAEVGGSDALNGGGAVGVGVGADGEADVVQGSGLGAIRSIGKIGEVIVIDVDSEITADALVGGADRIGRSNDADDLIGGAGIREIVEVGDFGDGEGIGWGRIAGAAAGMSESAIVETNDGGDDAGEGGGDVDGAIVAVMHVSASGRFFRRVDAGAGTMLGERRFIEIELNAKGGVHLRGSAGNADGAAPRVRAEDGHAVRADE